jgi:hypothetical protein
VFTKVAGLVLVANAVIWAVLIPILMSSFKVVGENFADPEYLIEHMKEFYAITGIRTAINLVIGAVGEGAMIKAAADIYLKRDPNLSACLKLGAKKSLTLLSAAFLGFVGVVLGMILLFLPGIYLSVAWFVIGPAIVIEGRGALGCFKRSMNLVSGSWCYVFCTFFIVYLLMLASQLIWSATFAGGNDASHTLFSVWGSAVALVPAIIYAPVFAIMKTVMYINLRVEKEAMNADVLARDLGEGGSDVSYRQVGLMDEEEAGFAYGRFHSHVVEH